MSRTRSKRGDDIRFFTSNEPRFFKMIIHDTIREGKLRIPIQFVKEYGNCLLNSVSLRVAGTGAVWQVELSKHGHNVWLENGWREFSEYYSLGYGHLLVFEHKGRSQFHVIIFDRSATEIKYPCDNSDCSGDPEHAVQPKKEPETPKNNNCDFNINPKSRGRSPLQCPRPHKTRKSQNSTGKMRKNQNPTCIPLFGQNGGEFISVHADDTTPSTTYFREAETFKRASAFQSENPYFTVVMHQSYILKGTGLRIPKDFAVKHLKEARSAVILCVSDGRSWPSEYKLCANSRAQAVIYYGWLEFVRDNNLKAGDVCVFELIEIPEIKFKVSIFRVDEDPDDCLSLGDETKFNGMQSSMYLRRSLESLGKTKASLKASAFHTNSPYFEVVIPSYIHSGYGLMIPLDFARRYLKEMQIDVTLFVSSGGCWPAKCQWMANTRKQAAICSGWPEFARDNNIRVGDICIFELIEISEIKLKVSIFRGHSTVASRVEPSLEKNVTSDFACKNEVA